MSFIAFHQIRIPSPAHDVKSKEWISMPLRLKYGEKDKLLQHEASKLFAELSTEYPFVVWQAFQVPERKCIIVQRSWSNDTTRVEEGTYYDRI